MRVAQVMAPQPQFCRPEDSLEYIAQLMWRYDCGFVPVCAGDSVGGPVGVITDRDICMCALFKGLPLSQLTVGDAISDTDGRGDQALRVPRAARIQGETGQGDKNRVQQWEPFVLNTC